MQEEVENRTVNLAVTTTKLTARTLMEGLRKYLYQANQGARNRYQAKQHQKVLRIESKIRRKEQQKLEGPHGKQSLKQLIRHSNGLKQVPVHGENLKEFEKILKKYGVDFAIMKETQGESPRYLVFFKARDEQILSSVLEESTRKQLGKSNISKKPSLLAALKKAKDLAAAMPAKTRQKEKDLSL